MEREVKKKLRIVLVSFGIILIPLFFLCKWFYAVDIHNRVMENIIVNGQSSQTQIIDGIYQLEKAKRLAKRNYLIYSDQARLYCMIKDYKKALTVINEYMRIRPNSKRLLYQKALIHDNSGHTDSAKVYYKSIYKDFKAFKNQNDSISNMTNFTFLIYGRDSVMQTLKLLKQKYPNNELIPSSMKYYDKLSREYYALNSLDCADYILK